MIRNQLSVFLENRNGQLCEITGILAENGINLNALNIAETIDYGVLRLIVDDERKAAAVLSEQGYVVSVNPVVTTNVPNVPGGLHGVLSKITEAGIGVAYMYSIFGDINGSAQMAFRVEDPEKLENLLK